MEPLTVSVSGSIDERWRPRRQGPAWAGMPVVIMAAGLAAALWMADADRATAQEGPTNLLDYFFAQQKRQVQTQPRRPRLPRAFIELRQKARGGDVAAMMRLARILDPAAGDVRMAGVRKSLAAAARWYRRAAQAGNRDAQFRLARIVHKGGKGIRQSAQTAFILYQAAARQGHVPAMVWVAWMLEHGEGTRRNPARAMAWYEKAAKAGNALAMTSLGLMHLTGATGVRDLRKAREWLEKAAAAGDAWAVNDLGAIHEKAWGVRQDLEQARQLYAQALEMGLEMAAANLKRVETRLAAEAAETATGDKGVGNDEAAAADGGDQPVTSAGQGDALKTPAGGGQKDTITGTVAPLTRAAPGKGDRRVPARP